MQTSQWLLQSCGCSKLYFVKFIINFFSLSQFYRFACPSPRSPVKALCHHLSTTQGELCFSKGDVLTVKQQVDQDWLLCSHGNQTGLVHIEYVQGLEWKMFPTIINENID